MNPEITNIEDGREKFRIAFTNLDEWFEKQKRNKQVGRVDIDLEHLIVIVSEYLSATRDLRMIETDDEKNLGLSKIVAKSQEVLDRLSSIDDLFEQSDVYIAAKRLLLEVHEESKKLY